jgi:hypothetical protein
MSEYYDEDGNLKKPKFENLDLKQLERAARWELC